MYKNIILFKVSTILLANNFVVRMSFMSKMTVKYNKSHENKSAQKSTRNKTKDRGSMSNESSHCICKKKTRATQTKTKSGSKLIASNESLKSGSEINQEVQHTTLNIKWAYPVYTWQWKTIKKIAYTSYILNGMCIFYSFILLIVSIRLELTIADFLNMVTTDDGYTIPITLGISSSLCIFLNGALIFVTWRSCAGCRNHLMNTLHFALICVGIILVVVLISVGIVSGAYPQYSKLDTLHNGITKAMEMYKNDSWIKRRVDVMQITFQCCGSKTYSEWFDIPWFDTTLASKDSDQQTRDDAPFSCCNRQSCYPCIHHDLMSVGSTYLYAPETNLSVSERGCYYVLFKHTQAIAWRVCVSVILLALLEMVVVAVHRLLQTAHVELFRYERNFHWHSAWLFGVYKERERAGKSVPPKPPPIPYELMN